MHILRLHLVPSRNRSCFFLCFPLEDGVRVCKWIFCDTFDGLISFVLTLLFDPILFFSARRVLAERDHGDLPGYSPQPNHMPDVRPPLRPARSLLRPLPASTSRRYYTFQHEFLRRSKAIVSASAAGRLGIVCRLPSECFPDIREPRAGLGTSTIPAAAAAAAADDGRRKAWIERSRDGRGGWGERCGWGP